MSRPLLDTIRLASASTESTCFWTFVSNMFYHECRSCETRFMSECFSEAGIPSCCRRPAHNASTHGWTQPTLVALSASVSSRKRLIGIWIVRGFSWSIISAINASSFLFIISVLKHRQVLVSPTGWNSVNFQGIVDALVASLVEIMPKKCSGWNSTRGYMRTSKEKQTACQAVSIQQCAPVPN